MLWRMFRLFSLLVVILVLAVATPPGMASDRPRVFIETDAGGDPDDEQSLVRFLLLSSEWEVEGIIANRPRAREGENRNSERTGLGIVRRQLTAYGACWTNLVRHDPRFPPLDHLWARTVPGYNDSDEGVNRLLAAVDAADPRPLWYADWGTDEGSATNNLRRALDRVYRERGPDGYARFKSRLRLASADKFGPHTTERSPPFPLWVDTFQPERDRRRWYHRFSALTATAGGFDLIRDVLNDHGPLGALYPTNTTHWAKEGDSMTFLYWMPNGLNAPEQPTWGGWGGRYGPNETQPGRPYFWANQEDFWQGSTHRDHTLGRWAAALQNEFRARLDWCVRPPAEANHPPIVRLNRDRVLTVRPGDQVELSAAASSDPDGNDLRFHWEWYREPGTFRGPWEGVDSSQPTIRFQAPKTDSKETLHLVVSVTDNGEPPLTRYARVIVSVDPGGFGPTLDEALEPPSPRNAGARSPEWRSPLVFNSGTPVQSAADWPRRRAEITADWHRLMGPWPPLLERPRLEVLASEPRETFVQQRVRLEIASEQWVEGWLLVPAQTGPLPAVVVPFYEPETSAGLNTNRLRDFALQLARRGMVALALGSPGGDAWHPETGTVACQPLSFLAYAAANAHTALTQRAEVDARRIGIVGHSYGGKWALFAAGLHEPFAACAVSDPGIVWDERRPNVNYWEPWYLGRDPQHQRTRGIVTATNPRTGAYRDFVAEGRDLTELQALLAPRPFLLSGGSEDPPERWEALRELVQVNELLGYEHRVGMTSRPGHDPTPESNAVIVEFFERFLGDPGRP